MRLVFLTNFYPPLHQGGYEEWCYEVATALRERGHQITVLTSRHRREEAEPKESDCVQRILHLEMELDTLRNGIQFFTRRRQREAANRVALEATVQAMQPDGIMVWGMWNVPRSLAAYAEMLLPGRVVHYLGDYWPTLPNQLVNYWRVPAQRWYTSLPKAILRGVALKILTRERVEKVPFRHTLYCSQYLKESLAPRIEAGRATVVYGGIDTARYLADGKNRGVLRPEDDRLRLLYAGRLSPEKGVDTALKTLALLVHQRGLTEVVLYLAGGGSAAYVRELKRCVAQKNLTPYVSFIGAWAKQEMPALYRSADLLLFPSRWEEPFGRVVVEAMASGLPVIGTARGGTAEIIQDGINGTVISRDEPAAFAGAIERLAGAPELRRELAANGRRLAVERFDNSRMIDEIEAYLATQLIQR